MAINITWDPEQLWKGCILAGVAHAIMVSKFPLLANEHSWDGVNYNMQDSSGQRGTITFSEGYCVAAFRNDNSERVSERIEAQTYFTGASKEIVKLASEETLQYLLDEVHGKVTPVITTAFWGKKELFTNDTFHTMMINGGDLLELQSLDVRIAMERWSDFYGMNSNENQLLEKIYMKKMQDSNAPIRLSREEVALLESKADSKESRVSFAELGIYWD